MNLQDFFQSIGGQAILVILILLLFGLILFKGKNNSFSPKELAISSFLVALSTVLSYIILFKAPYGGSVTLVSMLPIILASYIFSLRTGLIVGISVGLLNLILNPYIVHPLQLLLDYPIAFGALSLGGIFKNTSKNPLLLSAWIGIFARFICSFLSGVIFFANYTPEGWNLFVYSGVYNGSYMVAEGILISILLLIPSVKTSLEKLKNVC